jgi:hypothetical protein
MKTVCRHECPCCCGCFVGAGHERTVVRNPVFGRYRIVAVIFEVSSTLCSSSCCRQRPRVLSRPHHNRELMQCPPLSGSTPRPAVNSADWCVCLLMQGPCRGWRRCSGVDLNVAQLPGDRQPVRSWLAMHATSVSSWRPSTQSCWQQRGPFLDIAESAPSDTASDLAAPGPSSIC